MRRNQFSEWFVIDQGKLSAIYSSMFYPDQDALVPNWPPYDGNWPVLRHRSSVGGAGRLSLGAPPGAPHSMARTRRQ